MASGMKRKLFALTVRLVVGIGLLILLPVATAVVILVTFRDGFGATYAVAFLLFAFAWGGLEYWIGSTRRRRAR